MKRMIVFTLCLFIISGCSNSTQSTIQAEKENHSHDEETVDPSTTKDYSDFDAVKDAAIKEAEFAEDLTEEELAFAKKIRPLHFDLKTMILRMSGTGVLFLTGETDEAAVKNIIAEADEKLSFVESELSKIEPPKSMEYVMLAYNEAIPKYQQSIQLFSQYFETNKKEYLTQYSELTNKANADIKKVIFDMWSDELSPPN